MRKIGELKGKPIIEGNPNEIKNNQIHAKTEGGGITLSERKNGSLETISGGNSGNASGDSEVLYYKVIENNDEIILDGNPTGMTYSDYVSNLYQGIFEYIAKYISIKVIYEDKYIEINEAARVTGSQEYVSGSLVSILGINARNKMLKGFAIYSEKFTFLELSSNILTETPKGDFYVKAVAFLTNMLPGDGATLTEMLKKVIIPISKEEYYNL